MRTNFASSNKPKIPSCPRFHIISLILSSFAVKDGSLNAWVIPATRSGRSSQLTEALMYTTLSVPDLHSMETSSDSGGRSMLRVASLAFLFKAFTWSTTLANKVALPICSAENGKPFLTNHSIVLPFILLENSKAKAGEM
jgi:hypothetical protein